MDLFYKISVLVSVYDAEPYIERCARSLFEQTYPYLEFIFVDDCTQDNSISILEKVIKDYPERADKVSIIHHKENKGLAAVRNTAFDHATGDFICVVDSDDWMELDGIERLAKEQVATGADVVWGKALMHNNDGLEEMSEPNYKDVEQWRMHYLRFASVGMDLVNWRRIIRRSLLEDHHIRHVEGHDIGDDKQIMPLIAYYAKSFSSIDDIVYHYERRNPNAYCYGLVVLNQFDLRKVIRDAECMRHVARFFADKESKYLEAAEVGKLEALLQHRSNVLLHHSRKGFKLLTKWIMETPIEYRRKMGCAGLINTLKTSYVLSLFWMMVKKTAMKLSR